MSWLSVVSGFTLPASAPSTEVLLWVFPTSVELALQGHLGSFEDLLQGCEDSQGLLQQEPGAGILGKWGFAWLAQNKQDSGWKAAPA